MVSRSIGKYTKGFTLSLIIVSLFNALLVIAKELDEALKEWMGIATGHHWTTHGVAVIILFIVLGLVFSARDTGKRLTARTALASILVVTIISGLIIAGFYFLEILFE